MNGVDLEYIGVKIVFFLRTAVGLAFFKVPNFEWYMSGLSVIVHLIITSKVPAFLLFSFHSKEVTASRERSESSTQVH